MNKIYIVTTGEYSDYRIVKVFLDKEKAEKYAEVYQKTDKCADNTSVEEHVMYDDCFEITLTKPNTYYAQYIDLEDGELGWNGEKEALSTAPSFYEILYGGLGLMAYSLKSKEHAKKIAIEQYQIHTQRIFEGIDPEQADKEFLDKFLSDEE